ncbi:MAG: GTPase HflX [Rhodospirillaceae bacterium]|nr:GTPase HflX [Rhodospirillaceae bacterium]
MAAKNRKLDENPAVERSRYSAIILHPIIKGKAHSKNIEDLEKRSNHSAIQEVYGLAKSIDLNIVVTELVSLTATRASTLFGIGTISRIHEAIKAYAVDLVIVDHRLTAIQQRNLEVAWNSKVIDRTALILEIFGARARTHEGRLQVELAAQSFQRSRLVRSWTHLERQRGGAGFLGGPGERQIELDRRQIDETIRKLAKELEKVKKTRALHRNARKRVPFPIVALVGYTNAGKSTLFNLLTKSNVDAKDMLFATLDPTMRRVILPSQRSIIISDTVGFISNLPTHLIAAFRSTLEEVLDADLIIHVRDISHPDSQFQRLDVNDVLLQLGLPAEALKTRMIEVLNKADMLDPDDLKSFSNNVKSESELLISAKTGLGCEEFQGLLDRMLATNEAVYNFEFPVDYGAAIAWLHQHGTVQHTESREGMITIRAILTDADSNRFYKKFEIESY